MVRGTERELRHCMVLAFLSGCASSSGSDSATEGATHETGGEGGEAGTSAGASGEGGTSGTGSGSATSASSGTASGSGGEASSGDDATSGSATSAGETSSSGGTSSSSGGDTGGGEGLGPPEFDPGELDPASHGGTITFQDIGAAGWYPSRRDPASGPCDAIDTDTCCMAQYEVTGDQLTPWDADLIMTLRGPMKVKQLAVYQPADGGGSWNLVSGWDDRDPGGSIGIAFTGNGAESGFPGTVGTECLVDVSTATEYPCGPGSEPYCPPADPAKHWGWTGSKLFVLLARMDHADSVELGEPCSDDQSGGWWDAPWLGLSHGELVRSGKFGDCHCYAKDPAEWWLADGCGQFNVFEVVNDNNEFRNLDLFSTNFFGYAGYVGEGPCGDGCDVSMLGPDVDLIDKSSSTEAEMGAVSNPDQGPGAAFRRPAQGYRYFVMLLDTATRQVQLAIVHPEAVPDGVGGLLPGLPGTVDQAVVDALLELRLPS